MLAIVIFLAEALNVFRKITIRFQMGDKSLRVLSFVLYALLFSRDHFVGIYCCFATDIRSGENQMYAHVSVMLQFIRK